VVDEAGIQLRYEALDPVLDERGRRRFAAAEARAAGRGGVSAVSRITGLARSTIIRGLAELYGDAACDVVSGRVRRPGGGRKKLTESDATLLSDLQDLVEPTTRGDPEAPLLWTSRSLRNLAYPNAGALLITADCGGSNGARLRLWKRELQVLADELGMSITVCHLPPGTSKWNKIGVSRTHPRGKEVWNYTRDGGRSPETGSQVQVSNHCKLLSSKAMVVSVAAKGGT
jgi:Rhodopirellula transposase DDE domain